MPKFRNELTGVVVSVDDSKAGRYAQGWLPAEAGTAPKAPAKKAAARKRTAAKKSS